MRPATGPKISSFITGMEWSTSSRTCGARYGVPARLAGNSFSAITGSRTGADRCGDLLADRIGGGRAHDRTERRGLIAADCRARTCG